MNEKKIPIRKHGRFVQNNNVNPESLLFSTIPSLIQSFKNRKKRLPIKKKEWISHDPVINSSMQPAITWIGHASFLIQIGGVNLLIDPIFGNVSFLFPRILPPGVSINSLPPIHAVLLSHNHPDHMDKASLYALRCHKPQYYVPIGDKHWFKRRSFDRVNEYTWWQSKQFNKSIKFTFLPAVHWTQRGLLDKNRSLWGSWMIEYKNKFKIYFAGDTAYSNHFKEIKNIFGPINVALLPIGPCEPREWMERVHLQPDTAGKALLSLDARHIIPMHWGTFPFGNDMFDAPITQLSRWWSNKQDLLKNRKLHIVKVGQRILF